MKGLKQVLNCSQFVCDVYCASATKWGERHVVAADLSSSLTFLRGRAALKEKSAKLAVSFHQALENLKLTHSKKKLYDHELCWTAFLDDET